jgi:pyruvate,water dikinase
MRRTDGAIVERSVARKQRMTVLAVGGTVEIETPPHLQPVPALDDALVGRIGRLAISLESEVGVPVDIECAVQQGAVYLLQCRPITTLHRMS